MNNLEVTNIDLVEGGNVFKQGHHLTLGYIPRDEKGGVVDLSNKILSVSIWGRIGVVFEGSATFSAEIIRFTLKELIPAGEYQVEFTATSSTDSSYRKKFPTNTTSGRITVKKSSDDLEATGVNVITVSQLKGEQLAIQRAYESKVDTKVLNAETKSTTALSKATTAEIVAKGVQSQFDSIIVEGDSSIEAAAARVSDDKTYVTLKARLDAEKQELSEQLAEESLKLEELPILLNKEKSQGIATHNISNGGGYERKPVIAITFDDAYMNDYTKMKPVMDEFGVKGTIFINSTYTGYTESKLGETEIIEMYKEGWEFGSHTDSHTILSYMSFSEPLAIGDTTLKLINTSGIPMVKTFAKGTKIRLMDSAGTINKTVVSTGYSLTGSVLTLQLSEPVNFNLPKPAQAWLHEEDVLLEIVKPKEFLQSLNIPCNGLAYPWGSTTDSAKKVIQSHFSYARSATNGVAGTNGGVFDGDEIPLNQFEMKCSELLVLTDQQMDDLLTKVATEKSLLIVLGHTNGWGGLELRLRSFLTKATASKIEMTTVTKALLYHGNATNLADFTVSKEGRSTSGGVNILPRNFATNTSNLDVFPLGISNMRVTSSDNGGFPTPSGTFITYKTKKKNIGFWTFQFFHDGNSNDVYYRNSTGATTFLPWEKQAKYRKYPQVDLGTFNIPANTYIDKELTGVGVVNSSQISISGYGMPLGFNLFFMPYIADAKAYVRITNPNTSDLSTRHRFSVTVFD
ncbi:polysaccharide deacetylase family protein [Planococcus versutus]|uniref:NodB homology domain-containing protein n=1 Tax=Planococcus versutus TaxID=1302659 RepID=A0A1B1S5K1_9BACL|nr:polysaccharide deacetylase family protein [Planococcus versutus]ANU28464.1 hypothetical protein I858_015855 [Planococcus versutus]